jgi:dihydroneopterin aldolase
MHDLITLSNMVFFGRHGVYSHEREHGQRFHVDLELTADLEQASRTDQLDATIDYTAVYDTVKRIVEAEHYQLIEALCGRILDKVLEINQVKQATVRIRKPAAPVPGALDFVQVAMTRVK